MTLHDLAHSRAGDKGTTVNVSVIAFRDADYAWLEQVVTAARVASHLGTLTRGHVVRYTLPHLGAMNFVFERPPGESVTRTLALDQHGKSLSSALLAMELPERGDLG